MLLCCLLPFFLHLDAQTEQKKNIATVNDDLKINPEVQFYIDSLTTLIAATSEGEAKFRLYGKVCWAFLGVNQLSPAKKYADSAKNLAYKLNDSTLMVRSMYYHGVIARLRGDYAEALHYLSPNLRYFERLGDSDRVSTVLYQIGIVHSHLGNYDKSLAAYYRVINLERSMGNDFSVGYTLNAIGIILKETKKYADAEAIFKMSLQVLDSLGLDKEKSDVLVNLGNLYTETGEFDKAKQYYQEALAIDRVIGKQTGVSMSLANIAFLFDKTKQYDSALIYHLQALAIRESLPSKEDLCRSLIGAGLGYSQMKKYDSARYYLFKARSLVTESGSKPMLKDIYEILSGIYAAEGNFSKAYEEHVLYSKITDSLLGEQTAKQLNELQIKYETSEKEKDIALLNTQNRLNAFKLIRETDLKEAFMRESLLKDSVVARQKAFNQLLENENELKKSQLTNELALKAAISRENTLRGNELTKEKRVRWQLTIGSALLLLLGSTTFFMYRKQRAKNRIIQKQADDLQVLMREIHHRVKNNLQVISSLLDLQSLNIGDKRTSEALKESRNRVYSMALIHQNLYKEENIIGIEMVDYINKLVQSLFQSYNVGENSLSLETDIDPLLLDVDVVILIGLVLNELISNALKYAFQNNQAGVLQISLKKLDSEMLLKVKDNGQGFPDHVNVFEGSSFGYKLVKAFAQKLKAKLDVFNDNGACVLLHIRKAKFAS